MSQLTADVAPGAAERRTSMWSAGAWVLLGLVAVLASAELVVLAVIIPKYEEIFRDFGVQLPLVTAALIDFSQWFVGKNAGQSVPGYLVLIPVLIGAWAIGAMLASRPRTIKAAMLLAALALIILFLLIPLAVVALYLPTAGMVESLQGSGSV